MIVAADNNLESIKIKKKKHRDRDADVADRFPPAILPFAYWPLDGSVK